MSHSLRNASAGDIPVLLDLMHEFHGESGRALDRKWAEAAFSAFFQDPSQGAIWIVSLDGAVAGYVVLTVRFSMEFGGLDAFVDDLFVKPSFRRRGLGKLLLDALFDECRRLGVLAVHVETGHDNVPARGLYESCGLRHPNDTRIMLTAELGKLPSPDSR
ncbi:MAG TPA: GNAT family N-acetyltransferase [Opitutaceae bacterium]